MAMRWYVVHAYSGFENRVKQSLTERVARSGLQDKFGEILDRNLDDGDAQAGDFQTDAAAAYDVAGGAVNNACRRI